MISFWKDWTEKYPIISIEDGLDEDDWGGFNLDEKDTNCATWNGGDCKSVSWKLADGERAKLLKRCRKSCRMCGSKKTS